MANEVRNINEGDRTQAGGGDLRTIAMGGRRLGRATYPPGWRWSVDVGARSGDAFCEVAHLGIVLAGRQHVLMRDGSDLDLRPGDVFWIEPGHDSWVIGDEEYVSLHLEGTDEYEAKARG